MKSLPPSPDGARPKRASFGLSLLVLLVLGLLAAVALLLYQGYTGMMAGSNPQSARQFSAVTPGAKAQIVVEVTGLSSQAVLSGSLLQKNSDSSYSRTSRTVSIAWASASIVMGSRSDIKAGAILQVNGVLGKDDILTAEQIVILTKLVQVK